MANFDSEFFGLVFPGFQVTQKIHAQNSHPELSTFLSNFTFLNPKFIHGDFLLTGEINFYLSESYRFRFQVMNHQTYLNYLSPSGAAPVPGNISARIRPERSPPPSPRKLSLNLIGHPFGNNATSSRCCSQPIGSPQSPRQSDRAKRRSAARAPRSPPGKPIITKDTQRSGQERRRRWLQMNIWNLLFHTRFSNGRAN